MATETRMMLLDEPPFRLPGLPDRMSKPEVERLHLDRYVLDFAAAHGVAPFTNIRPGNDDPNKPPDFLVDFDNREIGVDCAVFTDPKRRQGRALMNYIRRRMAEELPKRKFAGLRGCRVKVSFGSHQADLPPSMHDSYIIEPLIIALESVPPDAQETGTRIYPNGVDGGLLHIDRITADADCSHLGGGLGFELDSNIHSEYGVADLRHILNRLVASHDQPAIQELIITAGGPDRDGNCWPMEMAMADRLIDYDVSLQERGMGVPVKHLEKVMLHLFLEHRFIEVPLTKLI